jgi:hypothetical protein
VIHRALPGGSNLIILYYCLMATWTGLGDNTELFWAVLSHQAVFIETWGAFIALMFPLLSQASYSFRV